MILQILKSLENKKRILILAHNDPDPDSISAAFGIRNLIYRVLKKKPTIAYDGTITRAENRELVRQCNIDMLPSASINFSRYDHTIVVDAQPQSGNIYMPEGHLVNTIIDHHITKIPHVEKEGLIADIREHYGSSCTIVTEYYLKLGLVPDENTATALCMGISTDAIGNARDSCPEDKRMLGFIYPHTSLYKIGKIRSPELPKYHYKSFRRAIENSIIIENLLFCDLGDVRNRELIAENADYLLRIRDIRCVFVIGVCDNMASFSLRYKSSRKPVGRIAIKIVKGIGTGGGHVRMAGGQVPLDNITYSEAVDTLKERLIIQLGIKDKEIKTI